MNYGRSTELAQLDYWAGRGDISRYIVTDKWAHPRQKLAEIVRGRSGDVRVKLGTLFRATPKYFEQSGRSSGNDPLRPTRLSEVE